MGTKTLQNPRKVAGLKGKKLILKPFKRKARFKTTIRSNLYHKRKSELLRTQKQIREGAA